MADVPGLARRFFVRATRALPFWLLGYLALHALEQAAVRTGRDALLAQLASTAHARLEVLCVLVPAALYLALLLHTSLLRTPMHRFVWRVLLPRYFGSAKVRATPNKSAPRRPRHAASDAVVLGARPRLLRGPWPRGLGAVHMLSGVLAGALLAFHLAQVWWPRVRTSAPSAAYVAMLETTSTPAGAALQLLFVTASLLHLGVAVVPGLQGLGLSLRHASGVAVALCTALWIWLVNLLSAYVAGAPLL
ncbi:MAG: hypothetical protein RL385_1946 [Pseudomonadota bacterium]|jgi:succinate dehydrogenase/fumarate reductase cytochrome b subunit